MKKIPLVFSGCLLGLVGAGNLLADSLPFLAHAFSLTGLFFWFFFVVYHAIRWQETKIELQQPALLSGMATFPMAGMILSTYLLRLFPAFGGLSQLVWWSAFLLDLGLILYFTKTHVLARPRANATPSWTVLYVGIAVAALTYPVVGIREIAYLALVIGFGLTFLLYPLIYHDLKQSPLPSHLLGQEGIYCAPLFSSFSSPGSCGWSKPAHLVLTDHGGGLARFLFLCFDAPTENDKRRFSTCFFSPDLSNSHHSDLFENGPRLVATTFLDSSRMAGNSSLSLDFSRCLRWLCGLSQRVGRHPFSLKPCHDYGKMHYTICHTL